MTVYAPCLYFVESLKRRPRCVLATSPTADGLPRRRCPCAPCKADRRKAERRPRAWRYLVTWKGQ